MKKIIAVFSLGLFLAPLAVLADGMIFTPPDYYMFETGQKAVIFYENNLETLVLSTTFQGSAKNFGWVVPTPSRPEVGKSSDELFTSLDELTRVAVNYPQPLYLGEANKTSLDTGVTVLETKKIDYYDISVLTADDAQALAKWLAKNNYQFPENSSYILESYINNRWYFTAVKIDAAAVSGSVQEGLRTGHATPLKLVFATDKIVYPLKISSLAKDYNYKIMDYRGGATGSVPPDDASLSYPSSYYPYYNQSINILLYVFTPEKKQALPGFSTQFAGPIKKETIKNLAYDDAGRPWFEPVGEQYFLTKLIRSMSYAEMTSDLFLRDASDNQLVNAKPLEERGQLWFVVAMSAAGLIILGCGAVFIVFSKNKS